MLESIYKVFIIKEEPKDYILSAADKILNNLLIVNPRFHEEVEYNIDLFPWDLETSNSPATYSLYLQALNPVFYLLRAYQFSEKKEYYSLAKKIIVSWIEHHNDKPKVKTNMVWYDHAVSSRIEVFVYYETVKNHINDDLEIDIEVLINEHIQWNCEEENYTKNHNHGIMQDLSILRGGFFLKNTSYIDLALKRLEKQIEYAFPNSFAHIENSIGYHLGVIDWVVKIERLANEVDDSYSKRFRDLVCSSSEFLTWMMSPTGYLTPYGDTFRDNPIKQSRSYIGEFLKKVSYISSDKLETLRYSNFRGENGIRPQGNHKLFQKDGYSFIRSSWRKRNFEDALFLLFKAGFSTLSHKHQDDLSLSLFCKGKEIFVDPGMYNYTAGNVYSDYFKSAFAHNTLLVDDQSFPKGKDLTYKVGMMSSIVKRKYVITRAYNNLYQGVYIDRSIIYLNENKFYLIDDFVSNEKHKYTQNFHLANDIEIIEHNLNYTLLEIKGTEWYLLIQQIEEIEFAMHKYGDTGFLNTMSVMAAGLNDFINSNTIQYATSGRATRFITEFAFVRRRGVERALNKRAMIKGASLTTSERIAIDISPRVRALPSEVDVELDGNKMTVFNSYNKFNNKRSAFYLMNIKDLSVEKVTAPDSHKAEFILKADENYILNCYSIDGTEQCTIWKAGYIDSIKGNSFIYSPINLKEGIAHVISLDMVYSKSNPNQYHFYVNTIGFTNIKIGWYIYRNGTSYDYKLTEDIQEIDYIFKESGMYSVILRVNDRVQKEVYFGNFPEIEILENT